MTSDMEGERTSKRRVRRPFRIFGYGSVALLVSWSFPQSLPAPVSPSEVPTIEHGGGAEMQVWDPARLSEPAVCLWIADPVEAGPDPDDGKDASHSCHHGSGHDREPGW